ncbi:MAG: tetratricopeptide repeat protein, partial [Lysobacter sp.]|nr:tetratricopeptide repeat protein [Lysobacter sp.]
DHYDTMLQSHVEHLRDQVDAVDAWPQKMAAINRHLFDEIGYAGDSEHYYDPRNSYLNEVFERRLGNPISLALVQIEVARRLGIPLDGVSFPGHFLVRLPVDDGVLVMDPFNRGRPLDEDELRQRARPHLNGEAPDDRALFQILNPATHRAILMRVLRNLHGVYAERDDWERAARSADRLLRLQPDNSDALRDRGLAYLKMGYQQGARNDLARYLQLNPDAQDSGPLRERLVELSSGSMRTN